MEAQKNTCTRLTSLHSALSSSQPLAPHQFGLNMETSNLKLVFPTKPSISA